MADQLYLPPAEDGNGNRIASAVAYFYQTGTTTPVTVYEDDGTTPIGTSTTADANGVFAQVFTASDTAIKIDVKTPLGASIPGYPQDPAIRVPTTQGQAAQVTFAPTVAIPKTDVQAAIENVQAQVAAEVTARTQGRGYTYSASVGTAGSTAYDFTGIPAWATEIVLQFYGISLSGTDHFLVQLGTPGGIINSGYGSASGSITGSTSLAFTSGAGFGMFGGNGSSAFFGAMTITYLNNRWVSTHALASSGGAAISGAGGMSAIGIDRVRVLSSAGNTFDQLVIRIGWR